jgi:hypothetical protein
MWSGDGERGAESGDWERDGWEAGEDLVDAADEEEAEDGRGLLEGTVWDFFEGRPRFEAVVVVEGLVVDLVVGLMFLGLPGRGGENALGRLEGAMLSLRA